MDLGPQVETNGKYPQNDLNTSKTLKYQHCFELVAELWRPFRACNHLALLPCVWMPIG